MDLLLLVPVSVFCASFFVVYLIWSILKKESGTEAMKEVSAAILEGSKTFLKRQYFTVAVLIIILASVITVLLSPFDVLAFVLGAVTTALAGYIGMSISVKANVRTANAARNSLGNSFNIAFMGGATMGLSVVSLGLVCVATLYYLNPTPILFVGAGFGSSVMALFARVGGGIYTKAADIGADLVGKVERGLAEDDPRNAAVIADAVGDNVGDVAGMGSDLFQSYVAALIAAMIVGSTPLSPYGKEGIILPLIMCAVGIFATIIGCLAVRTKSNPSQAINKGIFVTSIFAIVSFYFLAQYMMGDLKLFFPMLSGILVAVIIGLANQYYTSYDRGPTQRIARMAQSGPALSIIGGLATGMMSAAPVVIAICATIFIAFQLVGIYGISIAVIGMHALTGLIVAMDSYGPITDNASGIAEMANLGPETRVITDKLDSVGNTTKSICKAFAISDAALAELALFTAFFAILGLEVISITEARVVVGLLIGGALPFILSSVILQSVGKGAFEMVEEVRKQFIEIPGLIEGKAKPNHARCIDISTRTALREMTYPVILAIVAPIVVGILFGIEALGGLLAGSIVSGLILAILMANAGNMWDNAKKYIEAGNLGGKGTPAHAAAIIGDTVGDPLKDAAGPSLNVLIKLMNTISLLFAEYFLLYAIRIM